MGFPGQMKDGQMPIDVKYRPYLTGGEITTIIQALQKDLTNPKHLPIIGYLNTFYLKAKYGTIKPSLQTTGSPSTNLRNNLGIDDISTASTSVPISTAESAATTPVELYQKWSVGNDILTPDELKIVQQYRWQNDLMSPTEEVTYLASMGM